MDKIDHRILAALEADSRLSQRQLAQMVGLSKTAARNRIERMERNGTIACYTIQRGAEAGGKPRVNALLFVQRKDRMRGGGVVAKIRTMPDVVSCRILSGAFDIVLELACDSQARVNAIWEDISKLEEVGDITTSFVLAEPVSPSSR